LWSFARKLVKVFEFSNRAVRQTLKKILAPASKKWKLVLGEILQPSIVVNDWLKRGELIETDKAVAGNGWVLKICQVPANKRYWLIGMDICITGGGNFTFDDVGLYDRDNGNTFTLDRTAGKSTYTYMFPTPILMQLDKLSEIVVKISGFVGAGTLDVDCIVHVEDFSQ
jgi:hypothetical protein